MFVSKACAMVVLLLMPSLGVINPSFQPRHLWDIYDHVLHARVTAVDSRQRTATLEILTLAKGDLPATSIQLVGADADRLAEILALVPGESVVVFAGKSRERRSVRRDVLYYVGGGTWHKAQMGEADAPWTLLGNADEGKDSGGVEVMKATFNGLVPALWAMMEDIRDDRGYFPSVPFSRFTAERLAEVPGAEGIALVDLDGDGRLDVVIASPQGCHLLVQQADGSFLEKADAQLAAVAARSVAAADVNGDGRPDLLLDDVVYVQGEAGWTAVPLADDLGPVRSAAFVAISDDGLPGVVVSVDEGGLRAFRVSEAAGSVRFVDVTADLGLASFSGQSGTFAVGDWNGDGRADLCYLGTEPQLLIRTESGFTALPLPAPEASDGWRAAAFGAILDPGMDAVMLVGDEEKALIANHGGVPVDVIEAGNEIQDPIPGLHLVLAEDLNADGTIDLYALGGGSGSPDFIVDNRGYGSFMMPTKYSGRDIIPGALYNGLEKRGAAAGDLTGDGACDVLLSVADGGIWLLRNRTVEDRPTDSAIDTAPNVRKQIATRLLTVIPQGRRGVVGATVTLRDAEGRLIARRLIGSQVGQGSSGPQAAHIGVREPGVFALTVRFADGHVIEQQVSALATDPRHQMVFVTR